MNKRKKPKESFWHASAQMQAIHHPPSPLHLWLSHVLSPPPLALPLWRFILSEPKRRWMMELGIKFVTVLGAASRTAKRRDWTWACFTSVFLNACWPICLSYQADRHLPFASRSAVGSLFALRLLETWFIFIDVTVFNDSTEVHLALLPFSILDNLPSNRNLVILLNLLEKHLSDCKQDHRLTER